VVLKQQVGWGVCQLNGNEEVKMAVHEQLQTQTA
jgi:hypothetical protein